MPTTVLIVDDSKLARIVAGKAIRALQPEWERVEAANADEAMAVIAARQVDVALLDFNMPGRDGLELAAEIRALRPSMPIIARAQAVKAAFVPKPLTEDALRGFLSGAVLRLRTESP